MRLGKFAGTFSSPVGCLSESALVLDCMLHPVFGAAA